MPSPEVHLIGSLSMQQNQRVCKNIRDTSWNLKQRKEVGLTAPLPLYLNGAFVTHSAGEMKIFTTERNSVGIKSAGKPNHFSDVKGAQLVS